MDLIFPMTFPDDARHPRPAGTKLSFARADRFAHAFFHVALCAALALSQVLMSRSRFLNADNLWHFQLAKGIVSGNPVYWTGVDANRLFPDLIYGVVAALMPFGSNLPFWSTYYYLSYFVSFYISIVLVANLISPTYQQRNASVAASVAVIALFTALLPYWGAWLEPGNHGERPNVSCTAWLHLWASQEERFSKRAIGLQCSSLPQHWRSGRTASFQNCIMVHY
jgi:hypothetical protein